MEISNRISSFFIDQQSGNFTAKGKVLLITLIVVGILGLTIGAVALSSSLHTLATPLQNLHKLSVLTLPGSIGMTAGGGLLIAGGVGGIIALAIHSCKQPKIEDGEDWEQFCGSTDNKPETKNVDEESEDSWMDTTSSTQNTSSEIHSSEKKSVDPFFQVQVLAHELTNQEALKVPVKLENGTPSTLYFNQKGEQIQQPESFTPIEMNEAYRRFVKKHTPAKIKLCLEDDKEFLIIPARIEQKKAQLVMLNNQIEVKNAEDLHQKMSSLIDQGYSLLDAGELYNRLQKRAQWTFEAEFGK